MYINKEDFKDTDCCFDMQKRGKHQHFLIQQWVNN